jgi:hypothetical protein
MIIKIICAWCKADMGEREGNYPPVMAGGRELAPVSHGICEKCQRLHFPQNSAAILSGGKLA